MKIIIADDSMFARSIIVKAIQPLGYSLLQASNGQDAIDILETEGDGVKLILLDWNMPVLSGFDALKKIKADNRFSYIPVVMITSESDENNKKLAQKAGATGYIAKPFTADELVSQIKTFLK